MRETSATFDWTALARWELSSVPVALLQDEVGSPRFFDGLALAWLVSDSLIGVVDDGSCEVRIYSLDGHLRRAYGGRGSGPGECRGVTGAWSVGDGRVAIVDGRLGRISVFDVYQGYLGSTPLGLSPTGRRMAVQGFGRTHLVARVYEIPEDEVPAGSVFADSTHVWSVPLPRVWPGGDLDTTKAVYLGRYPNETHFALITRGIWHYTDLPIAPVAQLAVGDSFIAYAAGRDLEVAILPLGGGATRLASADVPSIRPGDEDFDARIDRQVEERMGRTSPDGYRQREAGLRAHYERVYDLMPLPEVAPAIADLAVDEIDRIWVRRWGHASDAWSTWWILQPDGTPIATIRLPADVSHVWADDRRLVGIRTDSFGLESVTVWDYGPIVDPGS